jgi:hypothetical protein
MCVSKRNKSKRVEDALSSCWSLSGCNYVEYVKSETGGNAAGAFFIPNGIFTWRPPGKIFLSPPEIYRDSSERKEYFVCEMHTLGPFASQICSTLDDRQRQEIEIYSRDWNI